MAVERRFQAGFEEEATDDPGLVLDEAGTAYVIEPGGNRRSLSDGGSGATVGAYIYLTEDLTDTSAIVPFVHTVLYDTDGFYDIGEGKFIVPADQAGIYQIGAVIELAADAAITFAAADIDIEDGLGESPSFHFDVPVGRFGNWIGGGSVVFPLHEEAIVGLTITFGGGGSRIASSGVGSTALWLARLGSLPA